MVINQRLTTEIGYRRHRKTVKFFNEKNVINAMITRGAHAIRVFASRKGMYAGNTSAPQMHYRRLSNKERRVDALALRAEERRDKLRKAAGSCK